MSQANTVLIYSTISENCRKLFNLISPVHTEFVTLTGLRLLCVDSKKIRNIITQSKNIIVDKVPTILVIRQDNGIELYDGVNAFKWTTDVINTYIKPPLPSPPPQSQEFSQPVVNKILTREPQQEFRQISPEKVVPSQPKRQSKSQLEGKPISSSSELMPTEEFDEEPVLKQQKELSEIRQTKIKRPPVGIRSDAGNYDFSSEFDDAEESERKAPQRNIKDAKNSKDKSGGIMALAQALQKDRESEKIPIQRE